MSTLLCRTLRVHPWTVEADGRMVAFIPLRDVTFRRLENTIESCKFSRATRLSAFLFDRSWVVSPSVVSLDRS